MEERTFTDEDGDVVLFVPPKNPEFEAIEVGEVERRIRAELPGFDDDLYELLATVSVIWVPPPAELADYLAKAISALDGILGVFQKSIPDEQSFPQWHGLQADLVGMNIALGMQRDRVERTCDHEVLEPAPDADAQFKALFRQTAKVRGVVDDEDHGETRRCKRCHTVFMGGTSNPPRTFSRRPLLPKTAVGQRPGRGAFLFFVTELLRLRVPGIAKIDAMKVGAKVIGLFWSDGKPPLQDHQLENLFRDGKDSAKANSLISAEEFMRFEFGPQNVRMHLVWVPLGKRDPDTNEVGST